MKISLKRAALSFIAAVAILTSSLATATPAITAKAASTNTITVTPSATSVKPGETFTAKIGYKPSDVGCAALQIIVYYDSSKLDLVSAKNSSSEFDSISINSKTSGQVKIVGAYGDGNVTSNDTLSTITFTAKSGASGTAAFSVKVERMIDATYNNVSVSAGTANVTIAAATTTTAKPATTTTTTTKKTTTTTTTTKKTTTTTTTTKKTTTTQKTTTTPRTTTTPAPTATTPQPTTTTPQATEVPIPETTTEGTTTDSTTQTLPIVSELPVVTTAGSGGNISTVIPIFGQTTANPLVSKLQITAICNTQGIMIHSSLQQIIDCINGSFYM